MSDLIDRQEAIDALEKIDCSDGVGISSLKCDAVDDAVTAIKALPSAQPENTRKRTESHACDLISRQAAIDALHAYLMYRMGTESNKKRLDEWINSLPSTQPEVDRMQLVVETVNTLINSVGDSASAKALRNAGKFVKNAIDGELPTFEEITLEEPERKRGKWTFYEDRAPVWDIAGEKTWARAYKCSECGFVHSVIEDFGQYGFCPNCGADMRGEQDG